MGDGSVSKAIASQSWGPEFRSPDPRKVRGHKAPVIPALHLGDGAGDKEVALHTRRLAGLVYLQ